VTRKRHITRRAKILAVYWLATYNFVVVTDVKLVTQRTNIWSKALKSVLHAEILICAIGSLLQVSYKFRKHLQKLCMRIYTHYMSEMEIIFLACCYEFKYSLFSQIRPKYVMKIPTWCGFENVT
jgi:xanthine/uracil permease